MRGKMTATQSQGSFLWTLPQPLAVFGGTGLVASASITGWTDADTLAQILMALPILLVPFLERLRPRREDWLIKRDDLFEDFFWVLWMALIWVPIFDEYYDTPISNLFVSIREASNFSYSLEAETTAGLLAAAMAGIVIVEFISYWAHRAQHRFLFLWRIHATHHHITKLNVLKGSRTHPLELLGLNLGGAVALAFLGASDDVVRVVFVFATITTFFNHSNLPLRPGIFGWVFTAAEMHQLHHSCDFDESNTNYGCGVIIWDRVFGTFSDRPSIERAGSGTGKRLSLLSQITIPFRSNRVLRNL